MCRIRNMRLECNLDMSDEKSYAISAKKGATGILGIQRAAVVVEILSVHIVSAKRHIDCPSSRDTTRGQEKP